MQVEIVSPTIQMFNKERFYKVGAGYYRHTSKHYKGSRLLHRIVWEYHNGIIPQKQHIHHKDGDKDNNQIENLQLLPSHYHISMEVKKRSIEQMREHMEKNMRPKAILWHKSKEGRLWHR